MSATALGVALALASAVLHAAWNIRLKSSDDPLRLAARAVPIATLIGTPVAAVAWFLAGRPGLAWPGWVLALLSGGVELAYFHSLSRAYRRGEISSIYPVARGTAPILAVALGVGLLGERLSLLQAAGVAALVAGIWLARPGVATRVALVPAIATGVCIAGHSALDRLGVQAGPWWVYAWAVSVSTSLWLLPWARVPAPGAATIGVLTVTAYTLVLFAFSIAPLAVVAPAREAGVVVVAGWGIWRLGEREAAWRKVAGALAVVAGTVLLVL